MTNGSVSVGFVEAEVHAWRPVFQVSMELGFAFVCVAVRVYTSSAGGRLGAILPRPERSSLPRLERSSLPRPEVLVMPRLEVFLTLMPHPEGLS